MPGHELTRGQVDDDGPGNTGIEVEVEVLQRLVVLEVGTAESQLELLPVSSLGLVVEQTEEELLLPEVLVDGLPDAERQCVEHAGEAKFLENGEEIVS